MHFSAYMAESIRAAIVGVDRSKTEAALAIGMTNGQMMRRRTAFVFQNYALVANKTALQNIAERLLVGIGRAMATGAEVILFDEPTSSLEKDFLKKILATNPV